MPLSVSGDGSAPVSAKLGWTGWWGSHGVGTQGCIACLNSSLFSFSAKGRIGDWKHIPTKAKNSPSCHHFVFLWDNEFKINFLVHCRPYIFFIKAVAFNILSPTILTWFLVSIVVFLVCLLVFVLKDSGLNWVSLKLLVFLAQEDLEIYLTSNHLT